MFTCTRSGRVPRRARARAGQTRDVRLPARPLERDDASPAARAKLFRHPRRREQGPLEPLGKPPQEVGRVRLGASVDVAVDDDRQAGRAHRADVTARRGCANPTELRSFEADVHVARTPRASAAPPAAREASPLHARAPVALELRRRHADPRPRRGRGRRAPVPRDRRAAPRVDRGRRRRRARTRSSGGEADADRDGIENMQLRATRPHAPDPRRRRTTSCSRWSAWRRSPTTRRRPRSSAEALRPDGLLLVHVPERDWRPVLRQQRGDVEGRGPPRVHARRAGRRCSSGTGCTSSRVTPTTRGTVRLAQEVRDRIKTARLAVRAAGVSAADARAVARADRRHLGPGPRALRGGAEAGVRRFLVPEPDGPVEPGAPPSFSVLIRTYQNADTVVEAVESALGQTLPPFEVVVYDDGSTDGTDEVLRPYGDRIVYLRRENVGVGAGIQRGGEGRERRVRGRARRRRHVRAGADRGALGARRGAPGSRHRDHRCGLGVERACDRPLQQRREPVRGREPARSYPRSLLHRRPGRAASTPCSRSAGRTTELELSADWDCWMRMIVGGSKAGSVDEPLLRYRLREGSVELEPAQGVRSRRVDMLERLRTNPAVRDEDVARARRGARAARQTLALARGLRRRPRRRRRRAGAGAEVVRDEAHGRKTRLKAAALAAAPSALRPLARRPARASLRAWPAARLGARTEPRARRPTRLGRGRGRGGRDDRRVRAARRRAGTSSGGSSRSSRCSSSPIAAARFLGPEQFGRQSFIAFVEVSRRDAARRRAARRRSTRYAGDALGREPARSRDRSRALGRPDADRGRRGRARRSWSAFGLAGATPQAAWFIAAVVVAASLLQRVPSAVLNGLQKWRAASVVGVVMAVVAAVDDGHRALGRRRDRRHVRRRGRRDAREPRLALVAVAPTQRSTLGPPEPVDPALRRDFLRYAFIASLGVILTFVVWRRSEFLFLNHYSTDSEIAIYSVAFSSVASAAPDPAGDRRRPAAGRGHAARRGGDRAHPPGLRAGDQAASRAHAPDDGVRDRARPADAATRLRRGLQRRRAGRRAPAASAADRHAHEPERGRARRDGQAGLPARERRGRSGGEHRASTSP